MSERIVLDFTGGGHPRYTHESSGGTCLRHLWMNDLDWLEAKAVFRRKHPGAPVETLDGTPVRMLTDKAESEKQR